MDSSSKGLEEARAESPPVYDDAKSLPGEITGLPNTETQRGLRSRHVQFLALGGCIGTGLFVGSGQTLSTVGPGKTLCCLFLGCMRGEKGGNIRAWF